MKAKENINSVNGQETRQEGNVTVFNVTPSELVSTCDRLYFEDKLQLLTIAASDERASGAGFKIYYLFGEPGENKFVMLCLNVGEEAAFPSITKNIHEASGYERKIRSFFGLEPVNHPNPRQIILHENWPADVYPLRKDFDGKVRPPIAESKYEFQKVEGEGIYEIPVGPVHAGIIEPGHFRFSVAGEEIVLLEPKLGYKHRGVEKLFETLPLADKVRLSERVSGDTSFTHALAFCQALETLANTKVPERAEYLRVIFSELERLANHLNDFGFILMDTGFSFGGATGMRLRETIMQWNEKLAGSRFLRGTCVPGGVEKDLPAELKAPFLKYLAELRRDFEASVAISLDSTSVDNRLEGTGKLDKQCAIDHGVIGVAGRALGLDHDARVDYPYAAYDRIKFGPTLEETGDVKARFMVRIGEVRTSLEIIEQAIAKMPAGAIKNDAPINLRPNSFGVGIAEAWRGTIVYLVLTDKSGNISRVEVRDPSFINWTVLGYAGKGNVVPDFPLINKSFNLSYSGNDL